MRTALRTVWLLPLLAGCSPTSRIQVRCLAPAGRSLDAARLHVASSASCPPGGVLEAPDANAQTEAGNYQVRVQGGSAEVVGAFRGKRCQVRLLIWHDENGDGVLNAGDLQGFTAPTELADHGLFGGNLTTVTDVTLGPL